jgi:hypothetical protein
MASSSLSHQQLRDVLVRASLTLAWFVDPRSKGFCTTAEVAQHAHCGVGPPALPSAAPLRILATAATAGHLLSAEVTSPSAMVALTDAVAATRSFVADAIVVRRDEQTGSPPWAFLSARALGDTSTSVAHNGIFIVALIRCSTADAAIPLEELITPLAEGIARSQRSDGTFRIMFDSHGDDNWELYGLEAILGIAMAALHSASTSYAHVAWHALLGYKKRFDSGRVRPMVAIFFINWFVQAARATSEAMAVTGEPIASRAASDMACDMADILAGQAGPLQAAAREPESASTVEVATSTEGVADAYSLACKYGGDVPRLGLYMSAIEAGVAHLARVQAASREAATNGLLPVGAAYGFGASLSAEGQQRCDIIAHAITALLKLMPLIPPAEVQQESIDEPQTPYDSSSVNELMF